MTRSAEKNHPTRIGAGILHYRSWPAVRETIDAVLLQSRLPDEILVIDHASGDGSAEEIRAAYPGVEVLELTENRGPAGGMNRLLAALLAREVDFAFLLTDDMGLAPDALARLAARLAEEPQLGAVGPLLGHKRHPERVFFGGGDIHARTWDLKLREKPTQVSDWKGKPPQQADFLSIGAILIRADAARETGPLAEHFYHELDDVDFTIRLTAHGWKLECVPAAVAWMDPGDRGRGQLVIEPPPYLTVRNRLGLIARNAPRRMLVRELVRVLSWLVRDAIRPRSGSRANLKPRLQGLIDFCRGRWGAPPMGR